MIEDVFKGLGQTPAIFHIEGGLAGVVYLKDDLRLGIAIESEELGFKNIVADSLQGSINGAHLKVVNPKPVGGQIWWPSDHDTVGQTGLRYQYCIVGTSKVGLGDKSVSRLSVIFPEFLFLEGIEKPQDMVFEGNVLRTTIHSRRKNKQLVVSIEMLQGSISVEDINAHVGRIERFITSTTGLVVRSEKVVYTTSNQRQVLYVAGSRPLISKSVDIAGKANNLPIFGDLKVLEFLCAYLESASQLGHAAHLHGTYIEYRQGDVYLDSRLSVLFAGIDSVFNKLDRPATKGEEARRKDYDEFLSRGEIKPAKLKKFLTKSSTMQAYVSQVSFQSKLDRVYDFVGFARLNPAISTRFNKLRNDIAHGNDYDFGDYIQELTDLKTGVVYPAITIQMVEVMAEVLWASIKKLAIDGASSDNL